MNTSQNYKVHPDLPLPSPFEPLPAHRKTVNITGQRFGQLVVFSIYGRDCRGEVMWLCRCDCGEWTVVRGSSLRTVRSVACGCKRGKEITHGGSGTPEYQAYLGAMQRCRNPAGKFYSAYGGRGIEFKFESFEDFRLHVGLRPSPKYSLDRIDNDGHYEYGNVRWATRTEQVSNRRSTRKAIFNGVVKTVTDWARHFGMPIGSFRSRLTKGWCETCTFTLPVGRHCRHKGGSNLIPLPSA
jgi:hypothetical protein